MDNFADLLKTGSSLWNPLDGTDDGLFSAALMCMSLIAIGLSLSVEHWMYLSNEQYGIPEYIVNIFLIISMLTAIAMILLIWCWNKHPPIFVKISAPLESPQHARCCVCAGWNMLKRTINSDPSIVGLVVFSLSTFGIYVCVFVIYAPCWPSITPGIPPLKCRIIITYDVIHMVFLSLLLTFCVKFHNYRARKQLLIHYGLAIIGGAAVIEWLDNAINSPFYHNGDRNDCFDACVIQRGLSNRTADVVGSLLYPLHTQFLGMSLKVLNQLFFSAAYTVEFNELLANQHDCTGRYDLRNVSNTNESSDSSEHTPLCRPPVSAHPEHSTLLKIRTVVKVCIVLVHLAWLLFYVFFPEYMKLSGVVNLLQQLLTILASLKGISSAKRLQPKRKIPNALEIIIFVTGMGVVVQSIHLASMAVKWIGTYKDMYFIAYTFICACLLEMSAVYFQTTFLFTASRINRSPETLFENPQSLFERRKATTIFDMTTYFCFINNGSVWLAHILITSLYTNVDDHDDFTLSAMHIAQPLIMFYRFNSAVVFWNIYVNK